MVDVTVWTKGFLSTMKYSKQVYILIRRIINSAPTRIVASHTCWPNTHISRFFNMRQLINSTAVGQDYAARIRTQIGDAIEMRYNLRTYGIPIHLLPLTETGAIKVRYFHEWLRIRKILDNASAVDYTADNNALARVVVCPCLNDVIFRQGTPSMKNPGNVIFRDTMINHLEDHYNGHRYQQGHLQQQGQIESFCIWLIETTIKTKGGRFLEWDKALNVWVIITNPQKIKSKVAIAYRDTTKRFLNYQKQQEQQELLLQEKKEQSDEGGSYAFLEGSKGEEKVRETIDRVPLRSDSNYNETSCWF